MIQDVGQEEMKREDGKECAPRLLYTFTRVSDNRFVQLEFLILVLFSAISMSMRVDEGYRKTVGKVN